MLKKYGSLLKIAATSLTFEDIVTEKSTVQPQQTIEQKKADFLYFRARAISAGDQGPEKGIPNPNGNGDYFPRKELESSYTTFVGRGLFMNHDADHPLKSVGKILDAYAVEDPESGEFYIECLAKIDRKLHPELARKVETGELNTVSMGCSCMASKCSVCGTMIHTDNDIKCQHLEPQSILKNFKAEIDLPEYGIVRGQTVPAMSINTGLSFNELSIVNVPADAAAFIKSIIASNVRNKVASKTLSAEDNTFIQAILESLDEPTKQQLKAALVAETKEDSPMPEQKPTVEAGIDDLMTRMNALDFMRMSEYIERRQKKAKAEIEAPKAEVKSADTKLEKAISKVKNSALGRIFAAAVKREVEGGKAPEKKAAAPELKPVDAVQTADEARQIAIEWQHAQSQQSSSWGEVADSGAYFAQLVQKFPELAAEFAENGIVASKKTKLTLAPRIEFKKAEKLAESTWTIYRGDRTVITADLKTIWEDESKLSDEKTAAWVQSEAYGKQLLSFYLQKGFQKTAALLGLEAKGKPTADKEVKKTQKALDKSDATEVGKHLEQSDPNKTDKKAGADMDKPKEESKKEEVKEEEKKEASTTQPAVVEKKADEVPADSVAVDTPAIETAEAPATLVPATDNVPPVDGPTEDKVESAFDKIDDKLIIMDGVEAAKDEATGEIIITDAEGKEVKRLPDGFGTDVPSVLKLLQAIMGHEAAEGEVAVGDEKPAGDLGDLKEEVKEINLDEPKPEDKPDALAAAKKDEMTKKAEETAAKEKELLDREAAVKAEAQQLKAEKFAANLRARTERCRMIVEAMVQKDMVSLDQISFHAAQREGLPLLDARRKALEASVNAQVQKLLAMDDAGLTSFEESVKAVRKQANVKKASLDTPLHTSWQPASSEDAELKGIFDRMGSGGGL